MTPFSTLKDVKTFLGVTTSTQDNLLNQLLEEASAYVRTNVGYDLYPAAIYTEYHDGNNTDAIWLRQIPVRQIRNVWLDRKRVFDNNHLLVDGTDYLLEMDQPDGSSRSGLVHRLKDVWPGRRDLIRGYLTTPLGHARKIIKVEYDAGFCPLPDDIKLAVHRLTAYYRATRGYGVLLQSEKLGAYSYSLQNLMGLRTWDLVSDLLGKYKRIPV